MLRGFGGFAEDNCELGVAFLGRVLEGVAGAITFGGAVEVSAFGVGGESDEARFAVDVGVDCEIDAVEGSVLNADIDLGVVDRLVAGVGDDEIGGAGAEFGVDLGDGVGIGGLLGEKWGDEEDESQDTEAHIMRVAQPGRASLRGVEAAVPTWSNSREFVEIMAEYRDPTPQKDAAQDDKFL